ncbi:MAG TPA: tetratricopeptide repeat protein [Chitinophagales bacterium]|nr:tetratricopeptide repeat protein [Chitinophagales bacterium]
MAKQKTEKPKAAPAKQSITIALPPAQRMYAIVIFAFSFLLYFNSIFNSYNMDDELVTQNHRLTAKGISAIPEIFSSPYYEDKSGYKYEYRPLVLVSFAIEHSLFGEHAWLSHFINVLLYSLMCLLLFYVLKALLNTYSIVFPFLITMIFAAHPVHAEVAASIKNRDEILALTFGLLSLWAAVRYVNNKKWWYLLPVAGFFLLGLLSKTTTITFVLLIPLLLVLLTGASFAQLMLLTTILVIPAVLFARLYSVAQQIAFVLLIFISSTVLYLLKHRSAFFTALKEYTTQFSNSIENKTEDTATLDFADYSFYKNKSRTGTWIMGMLICVELSVAGLYYGSMLLTCIPLLVLSLLFVSVRSEVKLLLITPISLIAVLTLPFFPNGNMITESALIVFLATIILNGSKPFKAVAIVNYIVYAIVVVTVKQSAFFLIMLALLGFVNKRTVLLSAAILVVSFGFYIKSLLAFLGHHKVFTLALFASPVIYAGALAIWQNKSVLARNVAVILLPVFSVIYFVLLPPQQKSIWYNLQNNYVALNHTKPADLTPVQAVRPLNYMELPVTDKDPLPVQVGTAMLILGKYLKLIIIPYPLSFYYGYAVISPTNISDPFPLFSVAIHIILLLLALFYFRKEPLLAAGLLVYLISISVFSNLVIPIPGMMGDRFLLIPSIGFCLLIGFALSKIFKQDFITPNLSWKTLQKPLQISLVLILSSYSLLTVARNFNWKDRVTLFRHDITSVENSAQAQNLLGLHLFIASNETTDPVKKQQLREEALPHLKRAIEIYPKFLNASFDYARLLEAMGRYDEAVAAYQKTALIDSNFTVPYFSMGIVYQNQGKFQQAADSYEKYLLNHPKQMDVYANLSYAYYKMEQYDKSIEVNRRALVAQPGGFDPTVNIAKTYLKMRQDDSALYYFEAAQRINPGDGNVAQFINKLKSVKQP